ncbi:MAG: ATP-dependent DNA helicase [Candidatus Micrarchaeota archaeon]
MTFFEWFQTETGKQLNPEQCQAVESTNGSVLVIAGAGTGKTMMITAKAAFLIKEKGIIPGRLLMLTFSREAARKMKEDVEKVLPSAQESTASTFHAFCYDLLVSHSTQTGVTEGAQIVDEIDAAILLHRRLGIPAYNAKFYVSSIEKAKDLNLTPAQYESFLTDLKRQVDELTDGSDLAEYVHRARLRLQTLHLERATGETKLEKKELRDFLDLFAEYEDYSNFLNAWTAYEQIKEEKNLLDYADLNKRVLDWAAEGGEEELAKMFDYVIVDEFQDTNRQQFDLLKVLCGEQKKITVVGDPNQAIYAFRGAYANNLEAFEKEFNAQTLALKQNYRSTNTILRTAHRLVQNNYSDPTRAIQLESAFQTEGTKVKLLQTIDPKEQARRVLEEIETVHSNSTPYNEIAILFRSYSSAQEIQNTLDRRGIPYQSIGGTSFFRCPEIRTSLAYLYVIANMEKPTFAADPAWWKLLHYKYGLSNADSHILAHAAKYDSIQHVLFSKPPTGLSSDGQEKLARLSAKIEELRKNKNKTISNLLLDIYESTGLSRWFSYESTHENRQSLLNLRYLHDLTIKFQDIHGSELFEFIEYLETLGEMGEELEAQQLATDEGIILLSCHAAKGLEFDHVFILDLVKDKFPLTRGGREPLIPDALDERYAPILKEKSPKEAKEEIKELKKTEKQKEERRLAYVACTRAKKNLNLCFAKTYSDNEREPSIFLREAGYGLTETHADLELITDNEVKARDILKDTDLERQKAQIKKLLIANIDTDPDQAFHHLLTYTTLTGKPINPNSDQIQKANQEAQQILEKTKNENTNSQTFNPADTPFSFTALSTYDECPKKYELAHILRMPTRQNDNQGDGALKFGEYIHRALEIAVQQKITSREQLQTIAHQTAQHPDYSRIDHARAKLIFDTFWARQADRLQNNISVEQGFQFKLDGYYFKGKIDRIDKLNPQTNEIEIIDYKTGQEPDKTKRARQLLLYALAVQNDQTLKAKGYTVKHLTYELLEQEKPRTYNLSPEGDMTEIGGRTDPAKLQEIQAELLEIAQKASQDYQKSHFEPSQDDKTCEKCGYKLYCPKGD